MPVIKSAKKQMRQDRKRTQMNIRLSNDYKEAIKNASDKPTKKNIAEAQSKIDKAAKKNVIHTSKAARLKRRVSNYA